MLSKRAADVDQLPLKNLILSHFLELASLCSFLDGNSNCNSSAYHRVVTHTDQTHHFYVSRNGRGTSELCVRVHTSHGIGHTVGSRTCSHVVWVKSTSCTAAGSYGEVLLAFFDSFFLVGTS